MSRKYLITEDNLIGGIASAMLKLKTLNIKKKNAEDLQGFIELIKFIKTANEDNYKELLYDKNFFVSETVLINIHRELSENDFSDKIDFASLVEFLMKNIENYIPEEVDQTMLKLQEIMLVLISSKSKKQTYL